MLLSTVIWNHINRSWIKYKNTNLYLKREWRAIRNYNYKLTTVIVIFIVDTIKVPITKFFSFDANSTCVKVQTEMVVNIHWAMHSFQNSVFFVTFTIFTRAFTKIGRAFFFWAYLWVLVRTIEWATIVFLIADPCSRYATFQPNTLKLIAITSVTGLTITVPFIATIAAVLFRVAAPNDWNACSIATLEGCLLAWFVYCNEWYSCQNVCSFLESFLKRECNTMLWTIRWVSAKQTCSLFDCQLTFIHSVGFSTDHYWSWSACCAYCWVTNLSTSTWSEYYVIYDHQR